MVCLLSDTPGEIRIICRLFVRILDYLTSRPIAQSTLELRCVIKVCEAVRRLHEHRKGVRRGRYLPYILKFDIFLLTF